MTGPKLLATVVTIAGLATVPAPASAGIFNGDGGYHGGSCAKTCGTGYNHNEIQVGS